MVGLMRWGVIGGSGVSPLAKGQGWQRRIVTTRYGEAVCFVGRWAGKEVVLLDEPASALDPTATLRLEDLLYELKSRYTIVIVTHNMQQAARISDFTAFFLNGELIEFGPTEKIFTKPDDPRTEAYITGRFG